MIHAEYTLEDVAAHGTADDCWVVVRGKVYDVTEFAKEHPGGAKLLTELAGKDITDDFLEMHTIGFTRYVEDALKGTLKK